MGTLMMTGCSSNNQEPKEDAFDYTVEQFADLQLLRYKVHGFEELPLEHQIAPHRFNGNAERLHKFGVRHRALFVE